MLGERFGASGSRLRRVDRVDTHFYRRESWQRDSRPCHMEVLRFKAGAPLRMAVHVDPKALELDFRKKSVRSDVPGAPMRRPGVYLHSHLHKLLGSRDEAILLNGNNVGYWGNQYAVQNGELIYKKKGAIFDDGSMKACVENQSYTFFCASQANGAVRPDTFSIRNLDLSLIPAAAAGLSVEDSSISVNFRSHGPGQLVASDLPDNAISGYPLISNSRSVWQDHYLQAWDPRLIFHGDRLVGKKRKELDVEFAGAMAANQTLAEHAMTVLGINRRGEVTIIVAEKSRRRSRGISVGEMAKVALREFGIRDAVVLGAAGDSQLASTSEGVLINPLVNEYAKAYSTPVAEELKCSRLCGLEVRARPVPSLLRFELLHEEEPSTDIFPLIAFAHASPWGVPCTPSGAASTRIGAPV